MTGPASPPEPLELAARLRARMRPLAVLLALAITLSAPVVLLAFRMHELRHQATALAHHAASLVEREAHEDGLLWTYEVPKLVGELRAQRHEPELAAVEVVDADGLRLEPASATSATTLGSAGLLWAASDVTVDGRLLGRVWVAVPTHRAYRDGLLVFGLFALIGLALGWLVYTLPTRTAGRAEAMIRALVNRLEQSRLELSELNTTLEQRVLERSEQLTYAYAELKRKEERLRKISSDAIVLQESERRAISRELHDAVGQALTAVRINVQLLDQPLADAADHGRLAGQTLQLVDEALEEVRRAVALLGPAILGEIGLAAAVEQHCADVAERTGIAIDCQVERLARKLPPAVETTCYRLVQEALTNVVKHAGADRVTVALELDRAAVRVAIADDGQGFEPDPDARGRGLAGIRERVYMLGGELELESRPGRGTRLQVTLPAPAAGSDEPAGPASA